MHRFKSFSYFYFSILVFSLMSLNCWALGLKKTIAVADFKNAAGIESTISLGNDFSAQLTDALIQSGKFIVLSRQNLSAVLGEQDLAASGRTAKANAAKIGKVIPAQILITGKITEFAYRKSGGAQGFSIKGFSLGGGKDTAHIALILQIIDTTTAQILDSKRIEADAQASRFSLGYSGGFSIGTSSFKKTPLGKATQIAIDRAVEYIAGKLSQLSWQGRVVTVKNNTIYINAGAQAGMAPNTVLYVYQEGEALTDPDTGVVLGMEKKKIAKIVVAAVQDKFSQANVLENYANMPVKRGDLVAEH